MALLNWKRAVEFYNRRPFIDFLNIRFLLRQFLFTPLAMHAKLILVLVIVLMKQKGNEKDEINVVIQHLNSSYTPRGLRVHEKVSV
jgi:hypothetical protein